MLAIPLPMYSKSIRGLIFFCRHNKIPFFLLLKAKSTLMIKSMRSPLLFLGCLFSLAMLSCGKDNDEPSSKSKTELLTAQVWKISTVGLDIDKNGTVDFPYPLEDCDKDDKFTFKTGGTGTADQGTLKCDAADPQTTDFTWAFKSNETILNVSIPNSLLTGDMTIKTLDTSTLETYIDVVDPDTQANVRLHIKLIH